MPRSETRDHIVNVASHLFYQNGYNLTGINEIIKEAKIAKATLYNHFNSKDDICIAFLESKNDLFLNDLKSFYAARKKNKNQLLLLFDFLKSFYEQKEFNGCWCINTYAEIPKDKLKIQTLIKKQKNELITFIESIITTKDIRTSKASIKRLSKQVYLLYEAAVSESHIHQEIWPIENAKEMCKIICK